MGKVTNITTGKIPRVTIDVPAKDMTIQMLHKDVDEWIATGQPPPEATVLDEAACKQYPFIKTLRLPINWSDLTSDEVNDMLDPFD